jgi:hypothetical protein
MDWRPAERVFVARWLLALIAACSLVALFGCEKASPTPGGSSSAQAAPSASALPPTAVTSQPQPETDALCDRFASAPIPSSDRPSTVEVATLHGCDAEALYYGIGGTADFARARQCGYAELGNDRASTFGGAEILMMIYANGRGVPVNLELALRFACQVGGAPAELEARLGRLWSARDSTAPAWTEPFDVCDDATSGYMSGCCAAHEERVAAVTRSARRRAASAGMPPELTALDAAASRFFEARSTSEVDLTGTLRARFSIEERGKLEDDFVELLEQLHDSALLPEKRDVQPLQQSLGRLTSRIASCKNLADMEKILPGTVSRAGIRKTQAAWQAYRAAFAALVGKLRPANQRGAWLELFDQKRVAQLEQLADGC